MSLEHQGSKIVHVRSYNTMHTDQYIMAYEQEKTNFGHEHMIKLMRQMFLFRIIRQLWISRISVCYFVTKEKRHFVVIFI